MRKDLILIRRPTAHPRPAAAGRRAEAAADYVATFTVTMYTVLVAFAIVVLWQRCDDINSDVRTESQDLTQLVWTAQRLPTTDRAAIRSGVADYTLAVLNREWPPRNEAAASATDAVITSLRTRLSSPFTLDEQTTLRDQELSVTDDLANARADRLAKSLRSYPDVMISALVLLSATTVLTPFLLGPRADALSVVGLVATVAIVVAALAFAVDLASPYNGAFAISRQPLQYVQQQLDATPSVPTTQ
jgi:hypothetical protein